MVFTCVFLFVYTEFHNTTITNTQPTFPSTTATDSINVASNIAHFITQSAAYSPPHSKITTGTLITTSLTRTVSTTDTIIGTGITTIAVMSADLKVTATTPANISPTFSNLPTHSTSQPDNSSTGHSSVGVIVVIAVILIVVFIIITSVLVLGIIVVCYKRKRNKQYIEGADCSTTDEKILQTSPTSKPEPVYFEIEKQDTPHYINTEAIEDKIIMQNPYSIPFKNHINMKKVKIQNNPSYSASSSMITPAEVKYSYAVTDCYKNDTGFV